MPHTLGSKSWINAGSCSISGALGAGVCLHGRPDSLAQKKLKAKCVKHGAGSEDGRRRLWSTHYWSVSHFASLSITVYKMSFRRAESTGTPETCVPLVQALARKQGEQQRAAWLALGNVEAVKAGPQLTAAQDWQPAGGCGSYLTGRAGVVPHFSPAQSAQAVCASLHWGTLGSCAQPLMLGLMC